jgi:hypothetical protein
MTWEVGDILPGGVILIVLQTHNYIFRYIIHYKIKGQIYAVDTSTGGLLVLEGVFHLVVSVSGLTWFIW